MKIHLQPTSGDEDAALDHTARLAAPRTLTGDATVVITEAFSGPYFVTGDGEQITVYMRDSGFEMSYRASADDEWQSWEAKAGTVQRLDNRNGVKVTSSSDVTPAVFKAIASLFMCDDAMDGSAVLAKGEGSPDELLEGWLDSRAVDLGSSDWINAYNRFSARILSRTETAMSQAPILDGVDESKLLATDDAAVWAEEFVKLHPDVDEGTMIAWFANCAETAKGLAG
jgi:hypothetical protein